jgi:hypothetical protein
VLVRVEQGCAAARAEDGGLALEGEGRAQDDALVPALQKVTALGGDGGRSGLGGALAVAAGAAAAAAAAAVTVAAVSRRRAMAFGVCCMLV